MVVLLVFVPLGSEDCHQERVVVFALPVEFLAEDAFGLEAHLLVATDCLLVEGEDSQFDFVEVHFAEAELDENMQGVAAEAFATVFFA